MTTDYDDLCKRLRDPNARYADLGALAFPAADAITALREQVAALEKELVKWKELHRVIAEELTGGLGWPDHGNAQLAIAATFMLHKQRLEKAEADNAALRKDAERYRWLRAETSDLSCLVTLDQRGQPLAIKALVKMDAMIDAAMLAGKKP